MSCSQDGGGFRVGGIPPECHTWVTGSSMVLLVAWLAASLELLQTMPAKSKHNASERDMRSKDKVQATSAEQCRRKRMSGIHVMTSTLT